MSASGSPSAAIRSLRSGPERSDPALQADTIRLMDTALMIAFIAFIAGWPPFSTRQISRERFARERPTHLIRNRATERISFVRPRTA